MVVLLSTLVNDSIETLTSLVLLFLTFITPDINGSKSSPSSSSFFFKFVTTWNGIVVGTETFIVLLTVIFITSSVSSPFKSVALYVTS